MQNNKTPGNDALTKEFYENFWNEIKYFLNDAFQSYYDLFQVNWLVET